MYSVISLAVKDTKHKGHWSKFCLSDPKKGGCLPLYASSMMWQSQCPHGAVFLLLLSFPDTPPPLLFSWNKTRNPAARSEVVQYNTQSAHSNSTREQIQWAFEDTEPACAWLWALSRLFRLILILRLQPHQDNTPSTFHKSGAGSLPPCEPVLRHMVQACAIHSHSFSPFQPPPPLSCSTEVPDLINTPTTIRELSILSSVWL